MTPEHKSLHKKVAVALLNWNGWEDTIECLSSLYANDWPNFEVYVGDNGSTNNSVNIIRTAFPHCRLLEFGQNYGFAEGSNRVAEVALQENADFIFFLNNDTVVDSKLISTLVKNHEKLGPRVCLGCNIGYMSNPDITWDFGSIWDPIRGHYHKVGKDQPIDQHKDIVEVDHVIGCAMFLSSQTLKETGLFDRRFFLNFEETDLCMRAKKMGIRFYSIPDAKLWHKISASFDGKLHNRYFFVRNRGLWLEKHFSTYQRLKWYLTEGGLKKTFLQWLRFIFTFLTLPLWIWTSSKRTKNTSRLIYQVVGWTAVWHHWLGRYGECPLWVLKASKLIEAWRKAHVSKDR